MKKRIVGAAVLISLVVILLPLVYKGPVEHTVDEVPLVRPLPPFESVEKPILVPPAAPAVPIPPVTDLPPPKQRVPTPEQLVPTLESEAVDTQPTEEPPAIVKPRLEKATVAEGWVVQVGSFSSQTKALALQAVLHKSDIDTMIQPVKIGDAFYYRVRVLPPGSRPEAEEKAGRIRQQHKLETLVVRNEG